MMQNKLTETQKEDCHKIATLFGGAFKWDDTPEGYEYWRGITHKLRDMAKHGTSDGKPWVEPEPPLTDRDACVHPRLMVMVRDEESRPWRGPVELQGVAGNGTFRYVTNDPKTQMFGAYRFARRATPAEIEAAK